jgi:phage shock protein PspC (stress-responsive transcriptional regulator)
MQTAGSNLLTRDDTILGVCQALGDDFGFNPLFLRIAFSLPLIWNPAFAVGAYLALGVAVMVSRLMVREPRRVVTETPAETPALLTADNEAEAEALAVAA